jgi:hypothetical protein
MSRLVKQLASGAAKSQVISLSPFPSVNDCV